MLSLCVDGVIFHFLQRVDSDCMGCHKRDEGWRARICQRGWGLILIVGNSAKRFVGIMVSSVVVLLCRFFCFFFSGDGCAWEP